MTDTKSWSPTLVSTASSQGGRQIACRKCCHTLCGTDECWKSNAVLDERPLNEADPSTFRGAGSEIILRRFYCPSCGAGLDTEMALPADPFLRDRLFD